VPLVFQANQSFGRSHPARHVNVVTATVGHECFPSLPCGLVTARVGKAGFLFHRQRIEFGAHHDGGAIAVLVDRNQPGLADVLRHLEAQGPHFGGQLGCSLLLLKSDFGVGVDVLVERLEFWIVALERPRDGALQADDVKFSTGL
jgi:hypothetical protein